LISLTLFARLISDPLSRRRGNIFILLHPTASVRGVQPSYNTLRYKGKIERGREEEKEIDNAD
jgi:hypothetical protein